MQLTKTLAAAAVILAFALSAPAALAQVKEKIVYDEARDGDFGPAKPDAKVAIRLTELGVFVIKGTGTDVKDDVDAFVFEVAAGKAFDFCLVGDAAEFKKLRSIAADGTVKEIAFGSSNLSFRVPRNITLKGLPPGKYHVEMMFGPNGATGPWTVKIGIRDNDTPFEEMLKEGLGLETAEKMKQVDWPGAISIFHGHNWGKDDKYPIAIKEAGFRATGASEAQIDECRKHGLRAFVFLWAHEAGTIPAKYKDDKTVLCYYLSDRIKPQQWGSWATFENQAFAADPRHPAFFTMNADWGGFDQFCPIVRGRVMEYYHYDWDAKRRPHLRYALLDQARQASIKHGDVPVCRIVEVRPEDMRKTRHTFFTSLAYGVRGFRTGGGGVFDTKNRDERGVPTRNAFSEELKKCNAAVNSYSPTFLETRCTAVYHTAPLPAGCVLAPKDSWLTLDGEEVLVGVFHKKMEAKNGADARYLLVANRDAFRPRTAKLTIAGKDMQVQRMDKASGKWVDIPSKFSGETTQVEVGLEDGGGELLKVAPLQPKGKPDLPKPTAHTERKLEGWTIRVDDRLLKAPNDELGTRALRFLEAKLSDIKAVVPKDKLEKLQAVTIVLDLNHGKLGPMQYHPSAGWLKANGYSTDLAKCVHIPRAADLPTRRNINEQPWVILHELAHAYHDQVLGFNNPRIIEAYENYKKSGRGDKTLLYNGKRVRHYALTDPKEFFAEMTEAYFGVNDFFPFNRAELRESEPAIFALMVDIWESPKKGTP